MEIVTNVTFDFKKVKELYNPFSYCPWGFSNPITENEVGIALSETNLIHPSVFADKKTCSRKDHISRIAWLAAMGFGSPINVYVNAVGFIEVLDGHHRMRAAFARKDSLIKVIAEGDSNGINKFVFDGKWK